jgi:hypothetical protein
MRTFLRLAAGILAATLVIGCSKTPPTEPPGASGTADPAAVVGKGKKPPADPSGGKVVVPPPPK